MLPARHDDDDDVGKRDFLFFHAMNKSFYLFFFSFFFFFFFLQKLLFTWISDAVVSWVGWVKCRLISQVDRVFTNSPGDLSSIPGRVIPKTSKMVLDTPLLSTQQYKVCIKSKVEQSREMSCALLYTSV